MNSNFIDALSQVNEPIKVKLEFRLYYDPETNKPLFYTMVDEPGDYILISPDEFAQCRYDVIIKEGTIHKVSGISIGKLVPSKDGYGTLRADVSIVGSGTFWDMKTYE